MSLYYCAIVGGRTSLEFISFTEYVRRAQNNFQIVSGHDDRPNSNSQESLLRAYSTLKCFTIKVIKIQRRNENKRNKACVLSLHFL